MKHQLTYKVQLLTYYGETSFHRSKVWFTTDLFLCMHDALEFVHWFACQLSTSFAYRILEFSSQDEFTYVHAFPVNVQPPIECLHYPPQPLTLSIKKKRREDRHSLGYYYEYPDTPVLYRSNTLNLPKF